MRKTPRLVFSLLLLTSAAQEAKLVQGPEYNYYPAGKGWITLWQIILNKRINLYGKQ